MYFLYGPYRKLYRTCNYFPAADFPFKKEVATNEASDDEAFDSDDDDSGDEKEEEDEEKYHEDDILLPKDAWNSKGTFDIADFLAEGSQVPDIFSVVEVASETQAKEDHPKEAKKTEERTEASGLKRTLEGLPKPVTSIPKLGLVHTVGRADVEASDRFKVSFLLISLSLFFKLISITLIFFNKYHLNFFVFILLIAKPPKYLPWVEIISIVAI